jgi:inorganic phosphate transporter, PiT family
MLIFLVIILALYLAFNLGANDVANSMGTSVGAKSITLKQALIIAGILEFTGAVLFGKNVSATLGTKIANPQLFIENPQILLLGMISVLISVGLWMQIATNFGLPVSSSHAIVGAIAGFSLVQFGMNAVDWSSIGLISIAWVITPLISGIISSVFYTWLKTAIFNQNDPIFSLQEWIPWLSTIIIVIFGLIVFPAITDQPKLMIEMGIIATFLLTIFSLKNMTISLEQKMAKYQVLSACFVAFAHGSNDVGNAIAPLAVINYIQETAKVPINYLPIPLWILIIGGIGIVAGLAIWGEKVITTIGEGIIPLKPSSGFCAEIATATTILLASRFGLPVSTSHALVGAVVGIGLIENGQTIKLDTLKSIFLAWVITIPIAAMLGSLIFMIMRGIFA